MKQAGSTEVHKEASFVKLFEEQKNQQYLELYMTGLKMQKCQCAMTIAIRLWSIHTLQSRDYHGYLEDNKLRQNGDEQRPARGIAAFQIFNTTINQLFKHKSSN